MFLLLLCLGTILTKSCPASCQLSCSPPPLSGFAGAASFHPFSHSTRVPMQFCTAAPAPSPSKSDHRMRWLLSAALRPARQQTPRLAARVAAAGRQARAQAVLQQLSRSCFRTRWFLHLLLLRCRHKTVLERFSYPGRRFLHAPDRRCLHSLHRRSTRPINGHCPRG
jgi:hypothetical protein